METTLQRNSFAAGTIVASLLVIWSAKLLAEEMPPHVVESGPEGNHVIQRTVASEEWVFHIVAKQSGKRVSPSIASVSYPVAKRELLFAWGPERRTLIAISNQGKFFDASIWRITADGSRFVPGESAQDLRKAAARALEAMRPGEKDIQVQTESMRLNSVTEASVEGVIRFLLLSESDEYGIEFTVKVPFSDPAFIVSEARVVDFQGKVLHTIDSEKTKALLRDTP